MFLAGGRINADHHAAFDPGALAYARGCVPDLAVLSIGAIEADRGFLDLDADEAMFERALLDRARRVMVVADATKCARHDAFPFADFAAVGALVTDVAPPAAAAGMTIVAADAQSSESDDPPSA